MQYRTIVADPAWPEYGGGKIRRGANAHYVLMSVEEIKGLAPQVAEWADPTGCHLYLWATNNYLPAGLEVMKAWGFAYKTTITWAKEGRFGLGQYFRGRTEHCLFGVKGMLPYRIREDGVRAQGTTLIVAPRGEHSVKPLALLEMAELVSHPPRLEMFARVQRPGWDAWGLGIKTAALL